MTMPKTAWGVILGIAGVLALAASIWAGVDYWHSYCAAETIHENEQDEEILAGSKRQVQQDITWLRRDIIDFTNRYGCDATWVHVTAYTPEKPGRHKCKGWIWEQFQQMVHDFNAAQENMKKYN